MTTQQHETTIHQKIITQFNSAISKFYNLENNQLEHSAVLNIILNERPLTFFIELKSNSIDKFSNSSELLQSKGYSLDYITSEYNSLIIGMRNDLISFGMTFPNNIDLKKHFESNQESFLVLHKEQLKKQIIEKLSLVFDSEAIISREEELEILNEFFN